MALDIAPIPGRRHSGLTGRTYTPAPAATADANTSVATKRDGAIDAVRTVCLLGVVVLHALMVGASPGADGTLATSVAMHGNAWFAPMTWILQVMPMFFIAGGFASLAQWRRVRERGGHWTQYAAPRIGRLLIPAAIMIFAVGTVIAIATASGLNPDLAAEAGYRIGQPLWFLAVYLGVSGLVPAMAHLHDRAPALTLAALAAGIVAVDVTRLVSGIEGIGFLNLAFAWLFAQQLGFALQDGWASAWSRRSLFAGLGGAVGGIAVLVAVGPWSADLITNLNPPTIVLSLLAVAHWFLLRLIKPALNRRLAGPRANRVLSAANPLAMTVYLWHMPIVMVLVGGMWAAGLPLPEPHSGAWWATRLPWLLTIIVLVVAAAPTLSRIERIRLPSADRLPAWRAVAMIALSVTGVAVVLLSGLGNFAAVLIGTGCAALAIACSLRTPTDHPDARRKRHA